MDHLQSSSFRLLTPVFCLLSPVSCLPSSLILHPFLGADTVQIFRSADKNLAIGNRWCAQTISIQLILGEGLKFRSGFDDTRQSILISNVEFVVCQHRRRAVIAGL